MKKYRIGPEPARIDDALADRLRAVEVATIGHFRHRGFVHHALRPLAPLGRTLVGRAVTVAIPGTDSVLLHHVIGMIRPGDILMIDRLGDDRHACLGGGVAFAAKVAGVQAVVLDGPCTDADEIREVGLPVFCRGISGITTRMNDLGGAINLPVAIGGVPVLPGDYVVMDDCGIVVIPPDEADETATEAAVRQARAGRNQHRIVEGEKLGDLSGASEKVRAEMERDDG
jgi:regulator of RNase E activity RraA